MRRAAAALLLALCGAAAAPEPAAPLVLDAVIPLPDVAGRIDHLALDRARNHLFVAELGNNSVDVVDIESRKVIFRIRGLQEPQGIAYVTGSDLIVVACGGDGTVRFYSGADFSPRGSVDLGDDADNVRVDPRNGHVVIGYGDGGLAVVEPQSRSKIADIALPGHPEGFQLVPTLDRAFVNIPDAREIAVVDLAAAKAIGHWKPAGLYANFPMAIAEPTSVIIVFRSPSVLAQFDATSGRLLQRIQTCGDADDVFVDGRRKRLYVSCGQGVVDVFQAEEAGHRRIGRVASSFGARTSLFVPELDRLFVAARAGLLGSTATIRIYRPA
jgi:YVTN family beta-propeller protein